MHSRYRQKHSNQQHPSHTDWTRHNRLTHSRLIPLHTWLSRFLGARQLPRRRGRDGQSELDVGAKNRAHNNTAAVYNLNKMVNAPLEPMSKIIHVYVPGALHLSAPKCRRRH